MEKSSTICSNSTESFLPGICKELIGSSLDFLEQSYDEETSIADSLISNFLKIHHGLFAISKAHEEQDEESQDNCKQAHCLHGLTRAVVSCAFTRRGATGGMPFLTVRCPRGRGGLLFGGWAFHTLPSVPVFSADRTTQALAIQATCAFEQLVVLLRHWLSDALPWASPANLGDELRQEVRKLGGYLQLFVQVNCCADYHLKSSFIH